MQCKIVLHTNGVVILLIYLQWTVHEMSLNNLVEVETKLEIVNRPLDMFLLQFLLIKNKLLN